VRRREAAASLGIVYALFETPNAMAVKLLLGIIAAFSLTVTANADQLVAINNLFLSLDDPLGDKTGRPFGPWIAFNTYNNTGTPIIVQVGCTIYDAARRVIGSQVVAAHVRDVRPARRRARYGVVRRYIGPDHGIWLHDRERHASMRVRLRPPFFIGRRPT
jgi:hypothetical protein